MIIVLTMSLVIKKFKTCLKRWCRAFIFWGHYLKAAIMSCIGYKLLNTIIDNRKVASKAVNSFSVTEQTELMSPAALRNASVITSICRNLAPEHRRARHAQLSARLPASLPYRRAPRGHVFAARPPQCTAASPQLWGSIVCYGSVQKGCAAPSGFDQKCVSTNLPL